MYYEGYSNLTQTLLIQISQNDVSFKNLDDHEKTRYLLIADNSNTY